MQRPDAAKTCIRPLPLDSGHCPKTVLLLRMTMPSARCIRGLTVDADGGCDDDDLIRLAAWSEALERWRKEIRRFDWGPKCWIRWHWSTIKRPNYKSTPNAQVPNRRSMSLRCIRSWSSVGNIARSAEKSQKYQVCSKLNCRKRLWRRRKISILQGHFSWPCRMEIFVRCTSVHRSANLSPVGSFRHATEPSVERVQQYRRASTRSNQKTNFVNSWLMTNRTSWTPVTSTEESRLRMTRSIALTTANTNPSSHLMKPQQLHGAHRQH